MAHGIERSDLGITAEVTKLLAEEREKAKAWHHPLPLALALQFWKGDQDSALALARMLADIEPRRRDDVIFVLARQANTPMNEAIDAAGRYVGRKFTVVQFQCRQQLGKGYPGECYDLWAGAVAMLSDNFYAGRFPYHSAFLFEADGCPTSRDWIDRLKAAHAETLMLGKRVTGPVMRYPNHHVNGTMMLHLSCWEDHPSLHKCPPTRPGWDCHHGLVMVNEAGPSQIIANLYGMGGMSESVFWTIGREAAWITSIKDGLHHHWARKNLVDHPEPWRNANCQHP